MKIVKLCLTIILELAGIYLFSKMVGWSFMESFFLGSLAIFAIIWLIIMSIYRNNNMDHAVNKNLTGVETGEIRPFQIVFTPYIAGTLSLVVISLIISIVYYLPYFT
ncbi:hypothetical protein D0U04_08985 [Bacillus clarus]|uniref:Putative membrane protein n=1 Tax=Bacillus clarus TaxID=2338372 RepID=A0A090ZCG7_9BACI|nr:hypothetical protein [Bacillus clarus]KFN01981.1 putative membrane protein [Bacillus clarus]RFT67235.1 hypothetical protein D0U04_08985 [Bacillus clarus]